MAAGDFEALHRLYNDRIAVIAGEFRSKGLSECVIDFLQRLLVVDPSARMTAQDALAHQWLA